MHFVKSHMRLFLVTVGALILVACGWSRFPSGELVMFTAFGPHAFEGRVLVIRPDGSGLTTVLAPQGLLDYATAYGNSLKSFKSFILVSVDQATGGGTNQTTLSIAQYRPILNLFTSLQQQLPPGGEGRGVPSPDNSKFVATMSPPSQPSAVNLWLSDFSTKQFRQLTDNPPLTQDNNPVWSPDGQQIIFVRVVFSPSLSTSLMTVATQGGQPSVLLGPSDGVGQAAFSPDGKQLVFTSVNGMEVMDLSTLKRTVILTPSKLYGSPIQYQTEAIGMSWAKTQDRIVLVLINLATHQNELWTAPVTSDGSNLQKIFTADPGVVILSVTFISN